MPGYKTPRGILGVGSGTANRLARWTDANTLGVSLLSDDATNVTLTSGQLLLPDGTAALPSLSFTNDAGNNTGFRLIAGNQLGFVAGGADQWLMTTGGIVVFRADAELRWSASSDLTAAADLILLRDAANILGQRQGTSAQGSRIYNTFTDGSNYERAFLRFASNIAEFGVEVAGTGTARNLDLLNAGASVTTQFQMGTGTGRAPGVGKANANVTAVGNVGVGEDDLITYSLPANSLSANGKGVKIKAWGTTVNNVNAKTLKVYFGSQVILTNSLAVSLAGFWYAEAIVIRSGASTQDIIANLNTNTATVAVVDQEITAGTQTDTAAITIKCTGEAVDNNDIVQEGLLVEFLN